MPLPLHLTPGPNIGEDFRFPVSSALQLKNRPSAWTNSFAQTGRDLDVRPSLIRKWKKRLEEDGQRAFPGKGHARDEELYQTKRENARLREEVAILKNHPSALLLPV